MTDLLFCNELEAKELTQVKSLEKVKNQLSKLVPNFVITLGELGAIAYFNGREFEIPAFATKAVDTTGAGDMFAGGFMYGLLVHKDIKLAGILGSYAASKIVSQFGARLQSDHKQVLENAIKLSNYYEKI